MCHCWLAGCAPDNQAPQRGVQRRTGPPCAITSQTQSQSGSLYLFWGGTDLSFQASALWHVYCLHVFHLTSGG